ncbi:MAG: amidohydrolase family protein [Planctomycetes bacterium]|nr:amidohydrolase family protein [Planctomycetota bacterium]
MIIAPPRLKPAGHTATLLLCLAGAAAPAPQAAVAQQTPLAIVGARIVPIRGVELERGTLIVAGGKIVTVGAADAVTVPPDAQRVDAAGKVIMPGLICTHNHVGGIGGADSTAPLQPDVRIYDSLNVLDAGYRRVVAGGLTTVNIMPGSGHLLSGQTVYLKMRKGNTIEDRFIRDREGRVMGGIKMANGTNSIREAPFPGTRAKSAALVRERYIKALEYRDKTARAAGDPEKMPPRDIGLEAMVQALAGTRIVHHHTHRHDDILTVLRLAKEFNFRVVLHHVSEGWKVADEIARAGVPCSVILVDSPGGKLEARDMAFENAGILEKAGVKVAFHTDDWITDSRLFFRMAALGVRGGMSREGALKALTVHGAEMLDLGDRIGTLEPGKDADFIVLSGDPLSVYSKVLETWVEGEKVFDRDDPEDHLHAVGGFGAGNEQVPYFCCFDEASKQ